MLERREHIAHELSSKLAKIWVFSEIILFSMVGAEVNLQVAIEAGIRGAALILIGLLFRSIGSLLCVLGSNLNWKERVFVVIAYLPKATVQAAVKMHVENAFEAFNSAKKIILGV
jgi:NhaP-type Na+/H+ or K+/H+ antiporter